MDRRQWLGAEDEDDLLQQQKEFLSKQKAPSANVKRVTRPSQPSAPSSQPAAGATTAPSGPAVSTPPDAGPTNPYGRDVIQMSVSDVLGEVSERTTDASTAQPNTGAPRFPAQMQPSPVPFPVAAHRKESKFALSRRAAATKAVPTPGSQPPGPAAHKSPHHSDDATPVSTSAQSAGQSSTQAPTLVPVPGGGPSGAGLAGLGGAGSGNNDSTVTDMDNIHRQNLQVVASMSQQEVVEAVDELAARLPAKTLAFLRARGAKKAASQGAGATTQQLSVSERTPSAQPAPPAYQPTVRASKATTGSNAPGSTTEPVAAGAPSSSRTATQPAGSTAATQTQPDAGQTEEEAAEKLPADPRLHARLRWGVSGEVVGVQPRDEVLTVDQVLSRDHLRKEEGVVPDGHTITEILILARSSHTPQRLVALHMLRALLAQSRPTAGDSGALGQAPSPRLIQVHPALLDDKDSAVFKPTWMQVWTYLVSELGIVSHLRLALDDSHMSVAGAAAGALAALVSGGVEESLQWEVLECCPRLAWPMGHRAPLKRPAAGATWVQHSVVAQQGVGPGASQAGLDAEEEEVTPEDVALEDPVAGLVQMQVLPRLRYLLSHCDMTSSAPVPLLRVLEAVAAHSEAAAVELVRCPGLLEEIKRVLLLHTQPAAAEKPQASTPSESGNHRDHAAAPPALGPASDLHVLPLQVRALRAMRVVCGSSATAAQLIRTAGLVPVVQGHILTSGSILSSATSASTQSPDSQLTQHALILTESLRLWRVCVAHGIPLMSFEGMHTVLCPLMDPMAAEDTATAPTTAQETPGRMVNVMRWHVARETHALVDAVLWHALAVAAGDKTLGAPMIQPGTAAALVTEGVTIWLSERTLRVVARHLVTVADMLPACGGGAAEWNHWVSDGLHPLLMLPLTTAVTSCWAAALHTLATYWSSIPTSTPVWEPLLTALHTTGLFHTSTTAELGSTTGSSIPAVATTTAVAKTEDRLNSTMSWQGAVQPVALLLLSRSTAPNTAAALGSAVVHACVTQLALHAATRDPPAPVADLAHAPQVLGPQQVAVAELLSALLRLTEALPCTPAHPQSQPRSQPASSMPRAVCLATHVAPVLAQYVVSCLSRHHLGSSTTLQPWQAAVTALQQPAIRLLLKTLDLTLTQKSPAGVDTAAAAKVSQQDAQTTQHAVAISDALLCVLVASPPGAESQCLTALRLLTSPHLLQHLLPHFTQSLQGLQHTAPVLYLSAAGVDFHTIGTLLQVAASSDGTRTEFSSAGAQAATNTTQEAAATNLGSIILPAQVPYPPPPTPPSLDAVSKVLFEGWAAAWLSMVAAPDHQQPQPSQPQPAAAAGPIASPAAARPVLRYPAPLLHDVQGSRLPVPPTWHMREALVVPETQRGGGRVRQGGASVRDPGASVSPVAASLIHACALEVCGSSYLVSCSGGLGPKLQAALHLTYLYDSWELTGQGAGERSQAGASQDREAREQGQDMAQSSAQWMDSQVRWPLAVLTHHYTQHLPATPLPPSWCGVRAAEKMAQLFGSSSFGDPLFAQHVALLLCPGTVAPVQQAAWTALVQDQALHLLPPTALCVVPVRSLLHTQSSRDPGLLSAMLHSFTHKDLDKAAKCGSVTAELAAVTLVSFMCDPLGEKHRAPIDVPSAAVGQGHKGAAGDAGIRSGAAVEEGVRQSVTTRAMSMARSLVQGLAPGVLQQVLQWGVQSGLGVQDIGSVWAQSCRGDSELMSKLKSILPAGA